MMEFYYHTKWGHAKSLLLVEEIDPPVTQDLGGGFQTVAVEPEKPLPNPMADLLAQLKLKTAK